MLKGKHILIGITGSIAAYKTAILVRSLVKEGAEVQIVMTEMAKQFITPLTMATLSKNPILIDFYNPENGDWNSHISLGLWADLYLIAPASANTIAKMANGIADNLLLTSYLSARCPVVVAPAMDMDMFNHCVTQENIAKLQKTGVKIISPASGELASGLEGKGRMEEPEKIKEYLISLLKTLSIPKESALKGRSVLINAGPTIEPIDPVRYISNHSSGKMGFAIASELADRGAIVTLICGPVNISVTHPNITTVTVHTANEMYLECVKKSEQGVDITILTAAVADFTPLTPAESKIKRGKENHLLELTPTKDIAAALGKSKPKNSILIGFALETDNEIENAHKKLITKNLDAIVLNSLRDKGAGFDTDTNKITILERDGNALTYPVKSKKEVASDIADYIETLRQCSKD